MPRSRAAAAWGLAGISTVIAVWACNLWIDRPVALWIQQQTSSGRSLLNLSVLEQAPDLLVVAATIGAIASTAWLLVSPLPPRIVRIAAAASFSTLAAESVKDVLKWVFGRPMPRGWHAGEPSFVGTGAYGFHWLHGGTIYNSFPSGHMTAICSIMSVLWIAYPRFRPLYAAAALSVAGLLVAYNYHFVGDVSAGAFLGTCCGSLGMWLSRERGQ